MPEPINELRIHLEQIVKCFFYFLTIALQSIRLNDSTLALGEKTLFFLERAQANLIYYEHDAAEQCIT